MPHKIFKWQKQKSKIRPEVQFGHYSDNNKSVEKAAKWIEAETLFKEKNFYESIDVFFEYLLDDEINNVTFSRHENQFKFQIYQGSKVVRGHGNAKYFHAKVLLAKMDHPSVPVMRRLLEENFSLYYSRYSLSNNRICMQFDSDIETSNPNKLYYALKELATKADRQDDLLTHEFPALEKLDSDHMEEMPLAEKEIKYTFMQQWIDETLQQVNMLEPDKFPGGIAFLLLALIYRIDFLIAPEGALMHELEKIQSVYFKKDNNSNIDKNKLMIAAIKKVKLIPKEEVFRSLFRTTCTFSIRQPKSYSHIAESINNANKSMAWYKENKYPDIARQISEYGFSFCQYSYSLPYALTELFQLFMEVNYNEYFSALGFSRQYYDNEKNNFNSYEIANGIDSIIKKWRKKYSKLTFKTHKLKYDNMVNFNQTFTDQVALLDFDTG